MKYTGPACPWCRLPENVTKTVLITKENTWFGATDGDNLSHDYWQNPMYLSLLLAYSYVVPSVPTVFFHLFCSFFGASVFRLDLCQRQSCGNIPKEKTCTFSSFARYGHSKQRRD